MTLMDWNERLDIHVEPMNKQHQEILRLINCIYDHSQKKSDFSVILKTIRELAAYTTKHFSEEEKFMESIGFPDLSVHQGVHANMLSRFSTHVAEFEKTKVVSEAFLQFLKTWLTAHICHIDRKYGDLVSGRKSAA